MLVKPYDLIRLSGTLAASYHIKPAHIIVKDRRKEFTK